MTWILTRQQRRCSMSSRAPLRRQGDDMDLPAGQTCGTCVHARRCTSMFGHIPEDEACDWSPSRFRASVAAHAAPIVQGSAACKGHAIPLAEGAAT